MLHSGWGQREQRWPLVPKSKLQTLGISRGLSIRNVTDPHQQREIWTDKGAPPAITKDRDVVEFFFHKITLPPFSADFWGLLSPPQQVILVPAWVLSSERLEKENVCHSYIIQLQNPVLDDTSAWFCPPLLGCNSNEKQDISANCH